LDAVPGKHLLLADSPADFAASIAGLLEDSALAGQLSSAGRAYFEERFTWDAAWSSLIRDNFLLP